MSNDPFLSRPSLLRINLSALTENFRLIRGVAGGAKVMPVVKSNAYGHGLVECSQELERAGADFLGVALLEEGIKLRLAGVKTPILVLGGIFTDQIHHFLEHDLDLLASSVFKLRAIEEQAAAHKKRARVHLEIDTGMERIGVHYYNSATLIEAALATKHCDIVGVSSHFSEQEREELGFTRLQLERFLESVAYFEKVSAPTPIRHIAASGAILQLAESHLDLVRPGLISYGVSPAPHLKGRVPLKPVMSLHSKVAYFKVVKAGTGVSYGHLWVAPQDTRVVTIPLGYGDGYLRRLSNQGKVLIGGKRHSIVGAVCMDQMMVDIGPSGEAYNGDDVVLIGRQGDEEISLEELSELSTGNAREFMVSTNVRLPRVFHRDGAT
ncbi:MAG: alanine racemase [Bdellovibrionota bacterium]